MDNLESRSCVETKVTISTPRGYFDGVIRYVIDHDSRYLKYLILTLGGFPSMSDWIVFGKVSGKKRDEMTMSRFRLFLRKGKKKSQTSQLIGYK